MRSHRGQRPGPVVLELVAAWVVCKVAAAEVAVADVSAELVVVRTAFGVAIVGGVIVVACGLRQRRRRRWRDWARGNWRGR
jgi:hypothetical protein